MIGRFWTSPRSLRAQLALFAISILLPALLAVAALLLVSVSEERDLRRQELLATARSISASVDLDLAKRQSTSEALATSDPIQNSDWAAAKLRATAMAPSDTDEWLVLTDETGRQIFNTNAQAAAIPPPAIRPANIRQAEAAKRPRVSNLFKGAATGRFLVAIDTPVTVTDKAFSLAYIIDPAQFLSIMGARPLPDGAFVTLLDRQGRIVARSQGHKQYLGVMARPDIKAAMSRAPEGVVPSRSLDGPRTIVAYTRSSLSGWATLVVLPRSAFEAPLLRNVLGLALVALMLVAAGTGLALFYSRTIDRELAALEGDAIAVGRGEVVARRSGLISNFDTVQAALSDTALALSAHDERQRLLINELNHRVKNALASVQSLAVQTFRSGDPDARAKFDTRLAALASSHDLLTRRNWGMVELGDAAAWSTASHADRVTLDGPPVTLRPQAALAMCMCLHELVTNSIKYGALSNDSGRVEISWRTAEDTEHVRLVWRETGGPAAPKPTHAGFGTRLIDRLATNELMGDISRTFDEAGLVVVIHIGLDTATHPPGP